MKAKRGSVRNLCGHGGSHLFPTGQLILFVGVAVLMPGWLGLWCVFLTSFFMSLMFPTIFALGLKELGPNTKLGGPLLVMAIVGGAILTPVMGFISVSTKSLALAYSVRCSRTW